MTAALSLEDAQQRLLALATMVERETVPVTSALGRTLAEDLRAQRTQPAADLSAMDGYAICGVGPWALTGESRAGHPFAGTLHAGEAVRISTGALAPEGTDAVLIQENAQRCGDTITATSALPASGQHIRRAGFDFQHGDLLLAAGQRVTPAAIALALAGGHQALSVRRRPHVVLMDTGDELADAKVRCAEHQIPASNGAMLAALIASIPSTAERVGPVPDSLDALVAALDAARGANLIVTTGGASVGDHDLLRPALEQVGAGIDFWRVAIKPGKPLLVARRDKQVMIGLPGNPVSAFVTGYLFVLPFLRALTGCSHPLPKPLTLPLAAPMPAGGPRREFVRGTLTPDGAAPLAETDSSALRTLAAATILIDRPAGVSEAKAGTPVPVYLLENGSIA